MKRCVLTLTLLFMFGSSFLFGQVYLEQQTRHRFAQLNFGLDAMTALGGVSTYFNDDVEVVEQDLGPFTGARLLIGGQHFWGHADFLLSIPLFVNEYEANGRSFTYNPGVETALKYYPWRMEDRKLRPFLGAALISQRFRATDPDDEFGEGPMVSVLSVPFKTGLTFSAGNSLIEAGFTANPFAGTYYYHQPGISNYTELPGMQFHLSYRYVLETTLSAEKSWQSGETAELTERLAADKKLNRWYLAVGLSSKFWKGVNPEGSDTRYTLPFINKIPNTLGPDLTFGYYLHKPDLHIGANFRAFRSRPEAFGYSQDIGHTGFGLEAVKFLFDYHGFVPFFGPMVSVDALWTDRRFNGETEYSNADFYTNYGFVFGWDIRPNRIQSFLLRTNLRWTPRLVADDTMVDYSGVEFNFIQLVIFPDKN
jgi:hypothetical protein